MSGLHELMFRLNKLAPLTILKLHGMSSAKRAARYWDRGSRKEVCSPARHLLGTAVCKRMRIVFHLRPGPLGRMVGWLITQPSTLFVYFPTKVLPLRKRTDDIPVQAPPPPSTPHPSPKGPKVRELTAASVVKEGPSTT